MLAMADNLLAAVPADTKASARPADVPEKFWDDAAGQIRADALLKSYRELEKLLSQRPAIPGPDAAEEDRLRFLRALGVPERPEDYEIAPRHELTGPDPEINARLHQAGFTPAQVQLVYDLAAERLLPLIAEAAAQFEADRQAERLVAHFGGPERFRRIARQIAAWGRANLPAPVFAALSTTSEGVLALEQMMRKGEPALLDRADAAPGMEEAELRAMVRDPRYWKQRDPAFIGRVTEGFRRLFKEG